MEKIYSAQLLGNLISESVIECKDDEAIALNGRGTSSNLLFDEFADGKRGRAVHKCTSAPAGVCRLLNMVPGHQNVS